MRRSPAPIRRRMRRSPRCATPAARSATTGFPAATLYVTIEPCAMCAGAILHARIARRRLRRARSEDRRVRIGDRSLRRTAAQSPRDASTGGVRADECGALLSRFFAARRRARHAMDDGFGIGLYAPAGFVDRRRGARARRGAARRHSAIASSSIRPARRAGSDSRRPTTSGSRPSRGWPTIRDVDAGDRGCAAATAGRALLDRIDFAALAAIAEALARSQRFHGVPARRARARRA